jgi:hypothetical protein
MKTRKAPPGAKRLIESLRNLGYECSTAIADLIDNSLAAGASEISVEVNASTEGIPAHIIIGDNGKGMNRDSLFEAMRFGAFQEYSDEDLGKYGLGLKTASLSQCTKLTVASKPGRKQGGRATKSIACWDLSHVYKTDDWDLITPSSSDLDAWEQAALDHETARDRGTVVVWSGLGEAHPLLCARNAGQRDHYLARLINEISDHLRMVFHRFMQGMVRDRPKLRLSVSGVELSPWDPFCLAEKGTEPLDIVKSPVLAPGDPSGAKKISVTMSPYVLPREDEFSSREAWKEASGPKNWNFQQGFYFYRNDRLLQAGGWSNLRTVDEHTKLLRVAVHFPGSLDKAFALNVTKMRAHIPSEIREEARENISKWVKTARSRYDRGVTKEVGAKYKKGNPSKPESLSPSKVPISVRLGGMSFNLSNVPAKTLSVSGNGGGLSVMIPQAHECSVIFDKLNGRRGELTKLCLALLCMLEAVTENRVKASEIPVQSFRKLLRKHL